MDVSNPRLKVAVTLIAFGVAAMSVRTVMETGVGVPAGEAVWELSWEARFRVDDPPGNLSFGPPRERAGKRLIRQEFTHPGLRLGRDAVKPSSRDIIATARKEGAYLLKATYLVHIQAEAGPTSALLSTEQRELFTRIEPQFEIGAPVASRILDDLSERAENRQELVALIFEHVAGLLPPAEPVPDPGATNVLVTGRGDGYGKAVAMVAMCRARSIPARVITGFRLENDPNSRPTYWVEVYLEHEWIAFDPQRGFAAGVPANYLPVRFDGAAELFRLEGGSDLQIDYEIYQQDVPEGLLKVRERRLRDLFDLSRLSLDTRTMLSILLLLPFGVLLTLAFRQVTGLHTFGTFTPTLLGFAAVYADPATAVVIFSIVAVIGIAGRAAPVTRGLQRTPRLGLVFTLVAIATTLAVSLMDYFELNPAGHVVLLPLVVLTSVIDRIYRTLDDLGPKQVVLRTCWTALISAGCFVLIGDPNLGRWIINYPEFHFITISLMLFFSLYKGPQLIDIEQFSWLASDRRNAQKRET